MAKHLSLDQISKIKELRSRGFSLPEISRQLKIGQGTVWRHIQGVKILDDYKELWLEKRKPSIKRKEEATKRAILLARKAVPALSNREMLLILASLYWAEGAKIDFNLTNTDPNLIKVFIITLKGILGVSNNRLRLNIRIYEDMDQKMCTDFWLNLTGLSVENLSSVNILKGKKTGKLKYGMCRVRVTKGGDMLKYLVAVRKRVTNLIVSPNSSTDRTRVS